MHAAEPDPGERRRHDQGGARSAGQQKLARPSRAEWIVAILGAAVVLSAIGYLLVDLLRRPDAPPDVVIETLRVVPVHAGYLVEFRARNLAPTTAARLTIEGTLGRDAVRIETSSTTIDFLPGLSARRAGLFFQHDPRRYTLEILPKGYERP